MDRVPSDRQLDQEVWTVERTILATSLILSSYPSICFCKRSRASFKNISSHSLSFSTQWVSVPSLRHYHQLLDELEEYRRTEFQGARVQLNPGASIITSRLYWSSDGIPKKPFISGRRLRWTYQLQSSERIWAFDPEILFWRLVIRHRIYRVRNHISPWQLLRDWLSISQFPCWNINGMYRADSFRTE